jgi:hypothetical protein
MKEIFLSYDLAHSPGFVTGASPVLPLIDLAELVASGVTLRTRFRYGLAKPPSLPRPSPFAENIIGQLPKGGWRIRTATARALAGILRHTELSLIIEFGSGVSSVVFAALAHEVELRGGDLRVVSIEESAKFAAASRQLLRRFGLEDRVEIVTTPVVEQTIAGWRGATYRLDDETMDRALGGRRADLVFVDGPASWLGRNGDGRYGALLAIRPYTAEHALLFADDALRRKDLGILSRWQRLAHVQLAGVLAVGQGLAVGVLQGGDGARGPSGQDPSGGSCPDRGIT